MATSAATPFCGAAKRPSLGHYKLLGGLNPFQKYECIYKSLFPKGLKEKVGMKAAGHEINNKKRHILVSSKVSTNPPPKKKTFKTEEERRKQLEKYHKRDYNTNQKEVHNPQAHLGQPVAKSQGKEHGNSMKSLQS